MRAQKLLCETNTSSLKAQESHVLEKAAQKTSAGFFFVSLSCSFFRAQQKKREVLFLPSFSVVLKCSSIS